MAFTTEEEEFYQFAKAALPRFLFAKDRPEEELNAFVKIFDAARSQIDAYFDATLILLATGIWLNQHARDRGTDRQENETDAALRDRIRQIPDVLTAPTLLAATQSILDAVALDQTVPVEFVSAVNVSISTNNITKNAGGSGWNAGAISLERIMPDDIAITNGFVDFQVGQDDKDVICGLSYDNPGATRDEIDFGIQPNASGLIEIYENGVTPAGFSDFGAYTTGSTFRVLVIDNVVSYWHKPTAGSWSPLYTSVNTPSFPMTVDTSIYDVGSSIDNVEIRQPARLVELKRDKAHYDDFTEDSGTGGTFAGTAPNMKFTPTSLPWDRPPFLQDYPPYAYQMVFSGSASAGNDGTFRTTGLDGNAVEYQNGSGVAEVDATVSWKAQKLDQDHNLSDGYNRAFLSRGYRMGGIVPSIVMILPYGTTEATRLSVAEMLRQKKAAGIIVRVERRVNP